ncbi:MAG: TniB family NTP-binding protein [Chloroflexota bacterium]|nr:TniB family NTP-binding protein [Chloroflexota bacterium]
MTAVASLPTVSSTPTPEEIRALPPLERLVWVEHVRVAYPRWKLIQDEITRCHQMNTMAAEPQCMLVTGPTGAGKTTLIETYVRRYPPEFTESGTHRPVVMATIPSPATIGNLTTSLLYALGDPLAGRGTIGAQTHRVMSYFRDCGTQLLILDELQHFVDRDSAKVLQNASNWLKTLIKETKVACVLVGLEGEAEQVVDINPQLARLFGDPYVLTPFRWDPDDPRTMDEFRRLMYEIEIRLPLNEPSDLSSLDTAARCYAASNGTISYLMALVRRATHLALLGGHERLDHTLLAQAFDQRLAGSRRAVQNPFRDEADEDGWGGG